MIYNKIKHKNGLIANLYILFAGLALVMFYYAHAPGGIDKLFYVPCALAFVMSVLYQINHSAKMDSIDIILMLIIILSILSDVLNSIIPTQFNAGLIRRYLEYYVLVC